MCILCAAKYIHQNPVKAGLVESPAEYKWRSYGAYINEKNLVDVELILGILQGKEGYKKFREEREENKFIESTETCKISDEKLIKEIKKK